MSDLTINVALLLLGGAFGFVLQWVLAERREHYELRRSIAPFRIDAYRALWVLCDKSDIEITLNERAVALKKWYHDGGGLFLSLAASKRFFNVLALLQKSDLNQSDLEQLKENLTWLRTEMKYHVGSYTKKEAHTQIPSAR
ncbi:MAG TPA: hypothetical protein VK168_08305 [Saprospiraceae bacterium]|nr:hypothetical protein [Saprospiraceae bacterium]